MTGQTLSHYQIQEKLGEGGMGVVYKALDTHLNRPVALKLLPADKVSDPERRKRFVQEARAASALNHPHIVTIYDIGSDDGHDFIAMEFVQGKTLDQLQHGKNLPLADMLKYSAQIADALAKAHAAGIVHRDLKPFNIMVTEDGRAKVLDFGLAKLVEPDHVDSEASTCLLQDSAPKTEERTLVGTVAYMSPEQAEGRKLDGRSDIFSFGSVLYEMSTGRRAFQGESKLSTLSAILREEPKPASELTAAVPRDLEKIIQRCLRKDPERRYQSMKDVKIALEELKEESDSGQLSAVPQQQRNPRRRWVLAAAAAVVLLGAAGAALWWRPTATPAPVEWRLRPLTADSGLTTTPALSPDGRLVAYASDRASNGTNLDLWVQPLTEGAQPIQLTKTPADDMDPSFSPDGGQIAFFSSREGGGIYLIPALGGQERLLVRGGRYPRFSPDGRWIAYSSGTKDNLTEGKVFIIPVGGGTPKPIAADIPWASSPVWSPDGRYLLVLVAASINDLASLEFWLISSEGGASIKTGLASILRARQIPLFVEGASVFSLDWIGDALFFGTDSSVWTIAIKNGSSQLGELRKLASGTTAMLGVRGSNSKLVFESRSLASHLWSLRLDLNSGRVQGPIQPLPHAGGSQSMPASSSDGSRLVYRQTGPNSQELRVRDMSSGDERQLYTGPALPDGFLRGRGNQALRPSGRGHYFWLECRWEADCLLGWRSYTFFGVRSGDTPDVRADLPFHVQHSRRRVITRWQMGSVSFAASSERTCENCAGSRRQSGSRRGMDHGDHCHRRQSPTLVVARRQSAVFSFLPGQLPVYLGAASERSNEKATWRTYRGVSLSRSTALAESFTGF